VVPVLGVVDVGGGVGVLEVGLADEPEPASPPSLSLIARKSSLVRSAI
jgi:hypothetical protein